jgi:hypothetical protein
MYSFGLNSANLEGPYRTKENIVRLCVPAAVPRLKWKGADATGPMQVLAARFIGGDALYGFFDSVIRTALLTVKWRCAPEPSAR